MADRSYRVPVDYGSTSQLYAIRTQGSNEFTRVHRLQNTCWNETFSPLSSGVSVPIAQVGRTTRMSCGFSISRRP